MAYGVTSNTLLLSLNPGINASQSSALVHCAEFFTTFISGISHFKFGNVDKKLFKSLVIPGVIGGIIGAYVLTSIPDKIIKPIVLIYLIIIGITIFYKALKVTEHKEVTKHIIPLGVVGGFFDATGGGGWGPIVTSTMIARGHNPKLVIGSVNASEWFVTMAEAAAFVVTLGSGFLSTYWKAILGLLVGGIITAPFAAYVTKKIKAKPLMIFVAILILVINVFKLLQTFKVIPSILK
ncbi:MAG: sulfite exporter TauE/SafE family protein [Candidatus Coatesbacteria bacterium]|nr:sulfite exporter TauE/SafE family protein [Candidatus Coatesbacteria bacterium]